jgi:regulator of replication initiation timing
MLSDFKSQLVALQEAMKRDFDEIDRLRGENDALRQQLATRDGLIERLQQQQQAHRQ